MSLPHKKIPDALCQLAKRLAAPAMPIGEEFQPEAAIVNYFGLGTYKSLHPDRCFYCLFYCIILVIVERKLID